MSNFRRNQFTILLNPVIWKIAIYNFVENPKSIKNTPKNQPQQKQHNKKK